MSVLHYILSVSISLMTMSCVTNSDKNIGTIRIHSELVYSKSGRTRPHDVFDFSEFTQEKLIEFADSVRMPVEDVVSELSDPFLARSLEFVSYDTIEPAHKIAQFYENEFLFEGWSERRGIYFLEMTNGGGDWLRVYTKGNRQVLVHIIGPWRDSIDELRRGEFTGRTIIFKFLHCTSDDVFGKDNLDKVKNLSLYGVKRLDPK